MELVVPESLAGITGPCPGCRGMISAPSPSPSSLPPPHQPVLETAPPQPKEDIVGNPQPPNISDAAVELPPPLPAEPTSSPLQLVASSPGKGRSLASLVGIFPSLLLGLAIVAISWVAAWQFGKAPPPSLETVQQWVSGLFPSSKPPLRKMLQIRSDAWNMMLEVPEDQWVQLHPGGNNYVASLINEQNPKCRVVMNVKVLGCISKDQGWVGAALRMYLRSGSALPNSKGVPSGAEKTIGGRKCYFSREEAGQSTSLFRPNPVTVCTYDLVENNIAYSFEFQGCGDEVLGTLPELAEGVLANFRPLVKDAPLASTNNLTCSDPRLLRAETGLDFPNPGPGWGIIPDVPTPLSLMSSVTSQRSISTAFGRAGERMLVSGWIGAPSVGYGTVDGDIAGLSVVQLPPELMKDLPHLADLIMGAWFPQVSINRENERPFKTGSFAGFEYDGQISSNLNPAPFVFRLARRGNLLYALGACSFSEKRSKSELTAILNKASWLDPVWDGSRVSPAYTPAACTKLWEHLILALGQERRAANQLAEALEIYQGAYDVRSSGGVLLALCETLALVNQAEKATELMDNHWREQEPRNDFLAGAAQFMAQHQRLETATTLFTTALGRAKEGQDFLQAETVEKYLHTLHDARAHDEALRVLDVLNLAQPSNHWHLWEAYILFNGVDTRARGIEIMEGLIVSMKKNPNLAREFLTFLKTHQCHDLGLAAAMSVLKLDPKEGLAWLVRASCEREMGDTAKATVTLAMARQYNPRLRDLDEIVYALSNDEGGPVLDKDGPQTTPVTLPPEVRQFLQRENFDAIATTEDPYQYIYRIRSITCDPGEPFRSTNRYSIRIQNNQGMEAFNILKISFRPRGERVQVNELRVRTPDGKIVSPSNMKEAFVTEDNADGMHTGMRILNLPVPGLTVGSVLEYTITEESLGVLASAINSSFHFGAEAPCALDILYLNSPVAKLDFRHSAGKPPTRIPTGMVWLERSLPALNREAHQPSLEKIVPVLWTGDGSESWVRLGAEYYSMIQDRMRPDETVKRLAKEKTKACKTDAERILVLSEYVRNLLSYAAIEFGMRGLIPNPAADSIKNRFGDCKDHSVLLCQLLNSVGVPARLALVNAATAVQPDLPSLGAFNHMITAVPGAKKDEWDFIDCTNKCMAPQPGVPPWLLAGKYALVLGDQPSEFNPESSRLVKIRDFPEDFEKVSVERTVQIIERRHLSIKESITISGITACELRQSLNSRRDQRDISSAIKGLLGLDRNRCQVQVARVENLTTLEKPLLLNLEYEMRNACAPNGSGLMLHLPISAEMHFLDSDTEGSMRRSPFHFQALLQLHAKTQFSGIGGMNIAPMDRIGGDKKYVSWKCLASNEDSAASITLNLTRKAGLFQAAEYAAFQDQLGEAVQPTEEVTLIPVSSSATPVSQNTAP